MKAGQLKVLNVLESRASGTMFAMGKGTRQGTMRGRFAFVEIHLSVFFSLGLLGCLIALLAHSSTMEWCSS